MHFHLINCLFIVRKYLGSEEEPFIYFILYFRSHNVLMINLTKIIFFSHYNYKSVMV